MQGSQLDVLKGCHDCLNSGNRVTLVSVVKTWGTSPRPVGSLLAVADDGRFYGSVSGGCVEEDLIRELINNPVSSPQQFIYGETQEERHRFGLPCGGALELIAEPLSKLDEVEVLITAIEQRKTVTRSLNVDNGQVSVSPWEAEEPELIQFENHTYWKNVIGPQWRLVIVGAGETGRFLAEFAQGLGFSIVVSDPRPDYRNNWLMKDIPLAEGFPDDVIDSLNIDKRTAIVTVAHDPKVDDMALLTALKSEAFYIGALGSKLNNKNRRARLMEHFDFTQEQVNHLHGPVGIDIGSKTPSEIAISILAEIIATKNGKT
ncbi:XdhC family protein [Bermanella marisrubri]|uniref:XdhC family protein n=1 Tax=Bermanella marisrubri TaxID=207949 RepID=Q1N657_9GAMM|nr:XdhC family protein [Bermanella marisrubri]EAT13735.1 hypothetical protein RED65_10094 [Oceanobacter sp. RED65] [Bermanella marisrubri]QIZ84511.1 XdhC family protein [Bermanella marisrubri]